MAQKTPIQLKADGQNQIESIKSGFQLGKRLGMLIVRKAGAAEIVSVLEKKDIGSLARRWW
ncbi:hypothetical protein [Burkholderia seminalis]|uniref:Uncharacterized protein n=1 Tax=Burkholderia seminalis TaxID=488731 RepID=A0A8A8D0D8_9BURK|nr:hypothetical protein [Burkholderia seminalis]QTO18186.1 hypothetical protein DT99_013970 [Burkholderia seminalis]